MKRSELVSQLRSILVARRTALLRTLNNELALRSLDDDESAEDHAFCELSESESRELAMIDDAIDRMRVGTYGVCEECGRRIPISRLEALPCATTCIECQRQCESRRLTRDSNVIGLPVSASSHRSEFHTEV